MFLRQRDSQKDLCLTLLCSRRSRKVQWTPCKFRVYRRRKGLDVYVYYVMVTKISLVNINHQANIKDFFLVMRSFRIYFLSNFQMYHTAMLTCIVLYIKYISIQLKKIKTKSNLPPLTQEAARPLVASTSTAALTKTPPNRKEPFFRCPQGRGSPGSQR